MKKFRRSIIDLVNRALGLFKLEIRVSNKGFWDLDPVFLDLYEKIRDRSLVKIDRCFMLYQFAKHAALLPHGDVAQVGVYKGGTAKMIAYCFSKTSKKFFLFDTFEGLPALSEKDKRETDVTRKVSVEGTVKQFGDVHLEDVREYFADCQNVEFKKGLFPETARGLEGRKFCFVYLDADLYQSTKDGLEFFYPKMVPGGVIMLDDYRTSNWPGVEKAVREFQEENHISPITTTWWQGLIICVPPSN